MSDGEKEIELPPIDIAIDPTALKILRWIQARLESIRIDGAVKFAKVWISDEEDQVLASADAMEADVCAVVPADPSYAIGGNALIEYVGSIPFKVMAVHYSARDAGGDPSEAVFELVKLAEIVREAMTLDRYMGGLCQDITFNGRIIRATDFDGASTRVGSGGEKTFYATSIPFISGWQKLRAR